MQAQETDELEIVEGVVSSIEMRHGIARFQVLGRWFSIVTSRTKYPLSVGDSVRVLARALPEDAHVDVLVLQRAGDKQVEYVGPGIPIALTVLQAVVLMLAIYEDAYWLLASAIVLGLFQIALVVDHFRLTQRVKSFSLMDQVVAEPLGRTVSRVTSVTPEAPARAGAGAAMAAALLGLSPDAVIIWEVDSKEVVYWNRAAERLYGYSHDEAVGQPRHHLLQTPPPEALAAIESRAGEVGVWGAQVRQRCRDGRFVEVTCRMSAISNPQARLLVLEVNREIRNESG